MGTDGKWEILLGTTGDGGRCLTSLGLRNINERPFVNVSSVAIEKKIMTAEQNKKIVLGFFEHLNAGRTDAALAAVSDSGTWWVAGSWPHSGTKTRAEFAEELASAAITTNMAESIRVMPTRVTAEEDRVAFEAES